MKAGQRAASPALLIYALSTLSPEPARFGFIVSKSVGKAHTRNLVRRRLKAASYELVREGLSGVDVVIRAHPESARIGWAALQTAVNAGVQQALSRSIS